MRPEPTHQTAWAGALLCFILFLVLFIAQELGETHSLLLLLKAIAFGLAVALFTIGFTLREREKDEPVFDLILAEREDRLRH